MESEPGLSPSLVLETSSESLGLLDVGQGDGLCGLSVLPKEVAPSFTAVDFQRHGLTGLDDHVICFCGATTVSDGWSDF